MRHLMSVNAKVKLPARIMNAQVTMNVAARRDAEKTIENVLKKGLAKPGARTNICIEIKTNGSTKCTGSSTDKTIDMLIKHCKNEK